MADGSLDEGQVAVTALRALAERRPDVELFDGFSEAELDQWPVRVPKAARAVMREIGGLEAYGQRYDFGPRGAGRGQPGFTDGHWTLSQLEYDQELIVGVAGERTDWGPVLVVQRFDDQEVTVEAPSFIGWLTGLVERLGDEGDTDRPEPRAFVQAVPSIEVAEGKDAELAALVGRGDSLTDVVDLRALPAYPCGVSWEPYYSMAYDTADTSGSEVRFRLIGGGRALLIESVVSGDYLGRPVQRHSIPGDAPQRAVAELHALAAELPDLVSLQRGCTDAQMDTWPVRVPEDVRVVLRELGGVRMAGLPTLRLMPGAADHGVSPEVHRMMGGDGSYWPIARVEHVGQIALAQVRIDARTGQWGYVVSVSAELDRLREYPEVTLIGESLPDLLLTVARIARTATTRPDFARHVAGATSWFFPNTGQPWVRPAPVTDSTGDPPAEVAELPPGTYAADLRDAPIPSDLCFHRVDDWPDNAKLDRLHFADASRIAAAILTEGRRTEAARTPAV